MRSEIMVDSCIGQTLMRRRINIYNVKHFSKPQTRFTASANLHNIGIAGESRAGTYQRLFLIWDSHAANCARPLIKRFAGPV